MIPLESLSSSAVTLPGNGITQRKDDDYRKRLVATQGTCKINSLNTFE